MTVEELTQKLVELCQRGRAQWEVRLEDYYKGAETEFPYSSPVDMIELNDENQQVILI